MKYSIIKVCGMRDAENIRAVAELGVDLIGLIFYKPSPRYVSSVSTHAGMIPDTADKDIVNAKSLNHQIAKSTNPQYVGVFVDDMIQNVVTAVYNYKLDYVQLHGDEEVTYIDNLRSTLDPDIRSGVKIIKAISISSEADLAKATQYEGHADLLLFDTRCPEKGGSGEKFDWSMLNKYEGNIPFILSGGIGPDDVERVKNFSHPRCIGIDLNSKFEIEPALKDVEKIKTFITEIK